MGDDSSLVTVQFTTDKGKECEVAIPMDCTEYWEDVQVAYESQADDDAYKEYNYYYSHTGDGSYWKFMMDHEQTAILAEFRYSINNDNMIFLCRTGPTNTGQQCRRDLEEYRNY
jgi:hypothetical protein